MVLEYSKLFSKSLPGEWQNPEVWILPENDLFGERERERERKLQIVIEIDWGVCNQHALNTTLGLTCYFIF